MLRSVSGISFALSFMAACSVTPTEDLIHISFGTGAAAPPIEVDTLCGNGGCAEGAEVEAIASFEDDGSVGDDGAVEILLYRLDFDIGGFGLLEVPYYAGETSIMLPVDDEATFRVRVAGDRQRDFFASRIGSGEANGVATLTLVGYDHWDEIIDVSASFDIAFGDFVVDGGAPDEPPEDDGGAQ